MSSYKGSQCEGGSNSSAQPVVMAGEEGDNFDLRDIVAVLWSGKWIITAIMAVVVALALTYAFLVTPTYEASALIQIKQEQSPLSGAQTGVLSMLLPTASPAQTEIAIMKSRSVLKPTVLKKNLDIIVNGEYPVSKTASLEMPAVIVSHLEVPEIWMGEDLTLVAKGGGRFVLKSPDGGKLLSGKAGQTASAENGAIQILVKRLDVPDGKSFSVKRIYVQTAIQALHENLAISEKGRTRFETGIVSLTLYGSYPVRIKNILNTITEQYIQQNILAQAAQARQSLKFINKQLPKIKKQLHEAQTKLTKYRTKKGVVNLNKQAESLLDNLTKLETQLTQIKLTESAMQERFTGHYPGVQALEHQKQDVKSQINALKSRINLLPSKEKDYLRLLQQSQVYQKLYATLLSKSQDLKIAQAATVGSARIVDPAVVPIEPIKPRKVLIGVLGIILGLFLGVLIVFLRRALNRAIQDSAEIENAFGLPVYAVVPHSGRQAYLMKKSKGKPGHRIPLLAIDDPDDPAVESIRSLRTSLNFALQNTERKVISIGGCTPGVGKSFLSVNLAHVLAMSGAQVLLIDADLRRGYLERYMGVLKRPGLSQVLSSEATPSEVVRRSPQHTKVDFVPSGPYPAKPYELLSGPRIGELIDGWSEEYDIVLMDTPPILSVAESLILNSLASTNFLVAKAGVQTIQELRMALDRMRQNGVPLEGFIFNDLTRQASSYTYGHYAKKYAYERYGKGA